MHRYDREQLMKSLQKASKCTDIRDSLDQVLTRGRVLILNEERQVVFELTPGEDYQYLLITLRNYYQDRAGNFDDSSEEMCRKIAQGRRIHEKA